MSSASHDAPPCAEGRKRHKWRFSVRSMQMRKGEIHVCDHCGCVRTKAGHKITYHRRSMC